MFAFIRSPIRPDLINSRLCSDCQSKKDTLSFLFTQYARDRVLKNCDQYGSSLKKLRRKRSVPFLWCLVCCVRYDDVFLLIEKNDVLIIIYAYLQLAIKLMSRQNYVKWRTQKDRRKQLSGECNLWKRQRKLTTMWRNYFRYLKSI